MLIEEKYKDNRYLLPMNPGLDCVVICDLDGTISIHTSGRNPFDYERVDEDEPCIPLVYTIRALANSGVRIIFVSGREKIGNCEKKTYDWICSHVMGTYDFDIYMREKGDHRHGYEVKKEIVEQLKDKYNIINIFEDDPRCVKMYRELGLQCSQAYDFDVEKDCAY